MAANNASSNDAGFDDDGKIDPATYLEADLVVQCNHIKDNASCASTRLQANQEDLKSE
jgi:hypothetical protein